MVMQSRSSRLGYLRGHAFFGVPSSQNRISNFLAIRNVMAAAINMTKIQQKKIVMGPELY